MLNSTYIYLGLALLLFTAACTSEPTTSQDEADTAAVANEPKMNDSAAMTLVEPSIQPLPYIVHYDDNTGKFHIDKNPASETVEYTAKALEGALNHKYAEIQLRAGERRKDTIYLHIDDPFYLTQSIGSAGANSYLAEATFAFTALDSVNVVNFRFEPGDHAMPGPYTRRFFDDFH